VSAESTADAADEDNTTGEDATTRDEKPFLDPSIRRFPWGLAALTGAATFLVEYALVGLLFVFGPVSSGAEALFDRLTIWSFTHFNAHFVPVTRSAEGITLAGPTRVNLVTDSPDPTIPAAVYIAIPIASLLFAGVLFEWWREDDGEGLFEGSGIVGAGLAVGYLLVGMLGTFVFVITVSFDQGGTASEAVDRIFAFAALLGYPLVLGSFGALLVRGYREYYA